MDTRSPIPDRRHDRAATKDALATFNKLEDHIHAEQRRRKRAFVIVVVSVKVLFIVMLGLLIWGLNS